MYKNRFSIITVTNRDYCINNIINNFLRQEFDDKELIIVINNDKINIDDIFKYIDKKSNIFVYKLPQSTSLGTCLNFGINKSNYNIIAKFDDDDYYGPYYLDEANKVFIRENCFVLGKQKTYYYLEKYKKLILKNSATENNYTQTLMGSTICFKREVFDKVKFRDISSREDYFFSSECKKNGYMLYSTSPYNHLVFKHADIRKHTFKSNIDVLMGMCKEIKSNIEFEDCLAVVNLWS